MSKIITAIAIALIFLTSVGSVNAAPVSNLDTNLNTNLDNGAAVFKANCAGCHAKGGNIVRRGKNLKLKTLHKRQVDTEAAISSLVTNGKGIMSAYGDKLTAAEIANVSAYVLERAEQGWK
ncbi:MAG: c-type cytochrome [Cyanobacteria bacterium J06631_2]